MVMVQHCVSNIRILKYKDGLLARRPKAEISVVVLSSMMLSPCLVVSGWKKSHSLIKDKIV